MSKQWPYFYHVNPPQRVDWCGGKGLLVVKGLSSDGDLAKLRVQSDYDLVGPPFQGYVLETNVSGGYVIEAPPTNLEGPFGPLGLLNFSFDLNGAETVSFEEMFIVRIEDESDDFHANVVAEAVTWDTPTDSGGLYWPGGDGWLLIDADIQGNSFIRLTSHGEQILNVNTAGHHSFSAPKTNPNYQNEIDKGWLTINTTDLDATDKILVGRIAVIKSQ